MITSLTNEGIKKVVKLRKDKNYRDSEGLFVVETENLVLEARALGLLKEVYTISTDYEGIQVSENVMRKISSTSSIPKVVGVCRYPQNKPLGNKVLVLDGVQDPGNVGTLIRSAVAFGFDSLVLSFDSCDLFNEKTIRASEGNIFKIGSIRGHLEELLITVLKDYVLMATDVNEGFDITTLEVIPEKMALILGSEGRGVSEGVKKLSTKNLYVSTNNVESLNVGVAGSILMYEINKKSYK